MVKNSIIPVISQEKKEKNPGSVEFQKVGGQAVLGRQLGATTPWLTERHGYDPTSSISWRTFY